MTLDHEEALHEAIALMEERDTLIRRCFEKEGTYPTDEEQDDFDRRWDAFLSRVKDGA